MANEILIGLIGAVIAVGCIGLTIQIIGFFVNVPKQLKRIADALEKEGKEDGK